MSLAKHKIFRFGFPFEVLNRDLKIIFTSNLVGSFGDGLYAYILPYYVREELQASAVEVGILYAVVGLAAAFTLLLGGMLADRYDRKKIMVLGWIAWLPAPLIFSLAENWLQMLPGMVLWGFWLGGPTSSAYITTSADKRKLTLTFTAISAAWSFGYIFSPALGGYLASVINMQIVLFSASILYALAGLILFFISSQHAKVCEPQPPEQDYSFLKLLRTRRLLKLSVSFASIMFVLMMFRSFIPPFLGDIYNYGEFEIGILGSISFFGSAVLGISLGKLGDKRGKSQALALSMILCSVSTLLLVLSGHFFVLIMTFFVAGGSYLIWSLMGAIVGPLAPEHIRARWISVPQTMSMFSSIIAPYIGGVLYETSEYYPFLVATAATMLLALMAYKKLFEE